MPTIPQRVLVTGAATGIGRAIVERFIEGGARVHFCDISAEHVRATCALLGGRASGNVADVAADSDVRASVAEAATRLGGIDVLVNNAGVGGPRASVPDTDVEEWRRCIEVNLGGAFLFTKYVGTQMRAQGSGAIVNISTSSALTGLPNRTAYVASKGGLLALTRNVARELGPHGIRCNAVLPGIVDNERGRALIANFGRARGLDIVEAEREFLRYVSLRTMVTPRDVAEMVYFLASPAAHVVSGQCVGVCGNMEWEE
jgi:NAD(P)-dependent dehydrogenase (short-subunit alcohol dehydrogenase family)